MCGDPRQAKVGPTIERKWMLEQVMGDKNWACSSPRDSLRCRLLPASVVLTAGPRGWTAFRVKVGSGHEALAEAVVGIL